MIERRVTFGPGSALTPVVRALLVANAIIYLLQLLTAPLGLEPFWLRHLALWPSQVLHHFAFWQLLTYQFLHGSFFHVLFNLFALWMFGGEVERALGSNRFLRLYLLSGIGAGLFHLLFNVHATAPVIGASGAIYGVLVAFAVLYPNRVVTLLLFFVLPIQLKAKYLVAIFIAISTFSGIESQIFGLRDGIAHLAHLGGALTGFLFLRTGPLIRDWQFTLRKRREWRRRAASREKESLKNRHRDEIDRILDHINETGYDALSEKEKELLKKASRKISDE